MKKEVDILVGLPCSGKSTHLSKNYDQNNLFVISMDNIRYEYAEKTGFKYHDFFSKPKEDETTHPLFGERTENGNWSTLEILNDAMHRDFASMIRQSQSELEHGKKVVVDMTNLTKKVRSGVMNWFKDVEDVSFKAVMFNFEDNMDLILSQNKKRGKEQDKSIPDFVIEKMAETFEPIELDEGISSIQFVDGLKGLKNDELLKKKERRNKLRR